MNSFRAVERALAYEAQRQLRGLERDRPAAGARAQADPRMDESAQATRGSDQRKNRATTATFRTRPGAGHLCTEERSQRIRTVVGRAAGPVADAAGTTYGITPYDGDVIVNQGAI